MCNGTDLGPNVKMWDCKNTSWEQRLREPTEFRAAAAALQFICNAFCNRCADNYCCENTSATTHRQEEDLSAGKKSVFELQLSSKWYIFYFALIWQLQWHCRPFTFTPPTFNRQFLNAGNSIVVEILQPKGFVWSLCPNTAVRVCGLHRNVMRSCGGRDTGSPPTSPVLGSQPFPLPHHTKQPFALQHRCNKHIWTRAEQKETLLDLLLCSKFWQNLILLHKYSSAAGVELTNAWGQSKPWLAPYLDPFFGAHPFASMLPPSSSTNLPPKTPPNPSQKPTTHLPHFSEKWLPLSICSLSAISKICHVCPNI